MSYSVVGVALISERAVLRISPAFGDRLKGQKDIFIELDLESARRAHENLAYCIEAIATEQTVKLTFEDFLTTIPKHRKRLP